MPRSSAHSQHQVPGSRAHQAHAARGKQDMRFYWAPSSRAAAVTAVACFTAQPSDGFGVGFFSTVGVRQQQHPHWCRPAACGSSREGGSRGASVTAAASMCGTAVGADVALTREAGKNAKLAALLEEAGISSVEVPCIAHQDGPDLPLLPAALADPSLAYVAVTSPEAAKVFLAGWVSAGEPPVSVACVGKATGEALRKGGVEPVFTPSKATAETLAAEIPFVGGGGGGGAGSANGAAAGDAAEQKFESESESEAMAESEAPRRILYPASAKAQKTLESGLAARGFEVRRLNTYDTVPAEWDATAEAVAAGASVAAFGSPSAVKTWAARLGVAGDGGGEGGARGEGGAGGGGGALAACIGETSARACREAGWPESTIFYPEKPGMGGWAKAVEDALAAAKASSEAGAVA